MNRLAHLQALYLKIINTIEEEKRQSQPCEAVILACNIAKKVIYREYNELHDKINGVKN